MKIEALGLVEIKGFLGAVAAADAALKTADVVLLNAEVIKGGQTTIQLTGDVAAVKVAVDSATAVAENLNCLLSSHVIPRMAEDTAKMVMESVKKKQASKPNKVEEIKPEPVKEEVTEVKEVKPEPAKTEKKNSDVKKEKNTKKKPKTNKK
ncbi:BMC domain-containing protein [Vagococcus carniphilus]|uniref:BMC domain-containing protein n=1 Tax=Vagococcus carniphilus TaxID=218144 RepID=A0A430B6X9_9ENTE|nr:BMC domain-containing protein [Vagococcus carniphilus]MDT2814493.1 BMC domain-containing protein [Vagococcus carniphilus]MDT2830560.1 BMC domain-containing protein [Vagococcus carniphilus]MDT2832606.1 BMC domain-containing protein [Vagococcus carniphilus]MDT2839858.1 BMC domain-containing protein [Vagococcus carniphilus]MDT2849753.1 BMC domain-containing protein [Vagococcus carniphilus]